MTTTTGTTSTRRHGAIHGAMTADEERAAVAAASASLRAAVDQLAADRGIHLWDECGRDACGHRHDPDTPCNVGVVDADGTDRPCGCLPCPGCRGTGYRPAARARYLDHEEPCTDCDTTGLAR